MRNYIPFLLFFLLYGGATRAQDGPAATKEEFEKRYQERITKEQLFGVYIPKNLDDAMKELDKRISPESQGVIKSIPEDTLCILLHNRLGQWMILNWGFYEGSRLSHYLRSAGITFPDDMADFLIIAYQKHLNNEPVPIKELAENFKEKRRKQHEAEIESGEIIYEGVRKRNY